MSIVNIPTLLLAIPRNPITAIGLPLTLGLLSGSPTKKVVKGQWYNSLLFPPARPPRKAFPIVWTTLYIAMGYASHLAIEALDTSPIEAMASAASKGLALYYVQLALNCLWSPLFFVKKRPGLALVDAALLTGTSVWMTNLLHEPTAGKSTYLLLPYCAWLSYATYINAGVWWLNRGRQLPRED